MTSNRFLAFTDIVSGYEILVSRTTNLGVVYHPRKMGAPIPWRAGCLHCVSGRQADLPLPIKRHIKLLCTRSFATYEIPSHSINYHVIMRREDDNLRATVTGGGRNGSLEVIHRAGKPDEYVGHHRSFQSKILHRSLSFLFSERSPTKSEVRAILTPLLTKQRYDGIPVGNHYFCRKIDWRAIVTEKIPT